MINQQFNYSLIKRLNWIGFVLLVYSVAEFIKKADLKQNIQDTSQMKNLDENPYQSYQFTENY